MAKKRPKNLYELLMEKTGSASGPPAGRSKPRSPEKKKQEKKKPARRKDPGQGRIQVSLSRNTLLAAAVLLAVLLAGMYGLGRYQASAGEKGRGAALASMDLGAPSPAAPSPSGTRARRSRPSPPPGEAGRKEKKEKDASPALRTLKGLCVISYAYSSKGKALARKMVHWLRSMGLEEALYASDRGRSWMVVVPLGDAAPKALYRRIQALPAPPFAERRFRFADQKMYFVTLRVKG